MGKNRKWQLLTILTVALLTIYNILPTIFYYLRPLNEKIGPKQSEAIVESIVERVDALESESIDWIKSFASLLHVHPTKIAVDGQNPQTILVSFSKTEEANLFRSRLPRAGSLVPFAPAQLTLGHQEEHSKTVSVQRQIPLRLKDFPKLFSFAPKDSMEYREIGIDRAAKIASILCDQENAPSIQTIQSHLRQEGRFSHLGKNSPFSEIAIDADFGKILLSLSKTNISSSAANENLASQIAKISRECRESVKLGEEGYFVDLYHSPNISGLLLFHLEELAKLQIEKLAAVLQREWMPKHPDLQNAAIVDAKSFENLALEQKGQCIILFSPLLDSSHQLENDALYISLKGFERISKNYESHAESEMAQLLYRDLQSLYSILYRNGFLNSPSSSVPFGGDLLFEKRGFAHPTLFATREEFNLRGSQKYAFLELAHLEERILADNRIETAIHQDLIQWDDDYRAAQVSLNPSVRFDTPKPVKNIFFSNLILSLKKMVRGDEKKIIRWGLDLSGGKTVEIELRDQNHNQVRSDADLKQGIRELYSRVGKMGLSEVSIRQVGEHIVLDFPGSQSLSASELIKASTMTFHILNEKFTPHSPSIGESVNAFLQTVWNEAVFLGKTDGAGVNEIARRYLETDESGTPLAKSAKALIESGLKLAARTDGSEPGSFNTALSKIVLMRGNSPADWHGQTHPLLIVFNDCALEGSQLENIHSAYDPSKGNYLSFSVASSFQTKDGAKTNPQNNLYRWTSVFSKEKILGTPNEAYTQGRGWRMAVVLNDTVISSPALESALKDSAMISGSFSQSEVQRLTADLKAGSLTFTPHILSEKNVSPELGQTDRMQGIAATIAALLLVVGCMLLYYRFAGFIASMAVIFNLIIMWAILQNLGATLTLAGIAGIILTVGMSIDANVLVFERIKEEYALTKRIASAIQAGYKKAFSAIIDSNLTTIIAALILLNFDAGPVKSFAMNLIIGIASSMFTALFVTRFYFTGWAKNPKNTVLNMANWVKTTHFDFLKRTKSAFAVAITVIIVGGYTLFFNSSSILGLDFTGGYSLHLELKSTGAENYSKRVGKALIAAGAEHKDFQIREMNPPNQLRILFAENMEQKGKPFFGLKLEEEAIDAKYPYEKNPRITWVVDALAKADIFLTPASLKNLHANWTSVSGQMSETMKSQAIFGFLLSFAAIFIYLAFRFEYKFAAAAILCLVHDVLITMALMGVFHAFGIPLQIDLITIAALMTAVGYSLNDTIIIFDRIREEMRSHEKRNLAITVNGALNSTLSRTLITSGSTLLVLIALLVLGGASIFGFALVMTIGVIFGTLSSWFIAAPLMLFFHKREEKELQTAVK